MNKEAKIQESIEILLRHEDELSDGYGYYSEHPKDTLRRIAIEIIDVTV